MIVRSTYLIAGLAISSPVWLSEFLAQIFLSITYQIGSIELRSRLCAGQSSMVEAAGNPMLNVHSIDGKVHCLVAVPELMDCFA